ncbi:hypothetical protein MY9_3579 [Bacillus sp. JS]|nr:hypothetical protein MY9_3579 [Bacillus sp. JS]
MFCSISIYIYLRTAISSKYKQYSTKFTEFSQKIYVSAGIVKGKREIDTYP